MAERSGQVTELLQRWVKGDQLRREMTRVIAP
jgi:hypothetical protein